MKTDGPRQTSAAARLVFSDPRVVPGRGRAERGGCETATPNSEQLSMEMTAQVAGLPVSLDPPAARRRAHSGGASSPNSSGCVSDAERARIVRRLRLLARFLDDAITIPGTTVSIGFDPLIGMVPGIGDALSMAISGYIIFEAKRLGASRRVLALMAANVAVDALVGLVPIAGDLADFALKANQRNLRLMGITPAMPGEVV